MKRDHERIRGEAVSYRLWPGVFWIVPVAVAYFLAAHFSLMFTFKPEGIAAIWPPEGIFLCAILLARRKVWPYLVVVLFLADLAAEILAGIPPVVSLVYSTALAGDAVLSAWLLFHFLGNLVTFRNVRHVTGFIFLSVLLSNALAAGVAALAAKAYLGSAFWSAWFWWWSSDGVGNLLVTPFILAWAFEIKAGFRSVQVWRAVEGLALLLLMFGVTDYAFSHFSGEHWQLLLANLVVFPFLIWASLRFGVAGTATISLVLGAILIGNSLSGRFSLLEVGSNLTILSEVIVVQVYLAVAAVSGLYLAAVISERKLAEQGTRHLNQVLRAVRAVNQLITREHDQHRILSNACSILMKNRDYRMVWIGLIEPGSWRVVPASSCGEGVDYLDEVTITWDESETGQGPTGTAIRTRQASVCCDLTMDPLFAPWRAAARSHGFASSVGVPIQHDQHIFGALTVYSGQTDSFDEEEVGLLEELACDLGYALQNLEEQAKGRQVEEQLRYQATLLANVNDAIIADDDQYRLTAWNAAAESLYGWKAEEVLGRNGLEVIQTEWPGVEAQEMRRRIDAAGSWRGEVTQAHKDGRRIPVEISIMVLRDENTQITGYLSVNRDIAARRQAEESLRLAETKYRNLVEQIPAVTYIDAIDENSSTIYISPQIQALTGYSPAEWERDDELWLKLVHPDDRQRVLAENIRSNQTGEPFQIEYRLVARKGQVVWVRDEAVMIYDAAGKPQFWQGILLDITGRKQAEELIHRRVVELEVLYKSGLELNRLLTPKEIAQKIIDLMSHELQWTNTTVRLYHPENDTLELLAFNLPGAHSDEEMRQAEARFKSMISKAGDGLSGWAVLHRQNVRVGEVRQDARYLEVVPGLHSGLYILIQTEANVIGVISIENEKPDAYSQEDERLMTTLANQSAIALENARLYAETDQRMQNLDTLRTIDMAITSSSDVHLTLSILLDQVVKLFFIDAVDVLICNPAAQSLRFLIGRGFRTNALQHTDMHFGEGYAGRSVRTRQMVMVPNLSKNPGSLSRSTEFSREGFDSYIGVPLIAKGEVRGVLELFRRGPLELGQEQSAFLEMLGGQAAIAIDNAQLFENLQGSNYELRMAYDETIEGWTQALDLRDKETEGHSRRVAEMTVRLASNFGCTPEELVHIRRGAWLHDIGKMGISDEILRKPGPLTDQEWGIMHQHPQFAYDMLAQVSYLHPALDIPFCHHEKWDGSGYPRGLRGEQIPLAARIFAVVDVWDALTSDRPYRAAWSREKALAYIREQPGKHFDPRAVEAFLRMNM